MSMDELIYDNRTILAKADLALSDLTTEGGVLQPAQAKKFIRILIKESVLLKLATVVPMRAPKQLMERIGFGGRILRAGSESTPLTPDQRVRPRTGRAELDAQLFKAEVRLNNEVLEDSIERGALRQTIMQMMGEQISTDMDEIVVRGDRASADETLSQIDGVLKQATSHVVDCGGNPTDRRIFRDMMKSLPSPYLRRRQRQEVQALLRCLGVIGRVPIQAQLSEHPLLPCFPRPRPSRRLSFQQALWAVAHRVTSAASRLRNAHGCAQDLDVSFESETVSPRN